MGSSTPIKEVLTPRCDVESVDNGDAAATGIHEAHVKKDLQSRHINMIAIAGMIGTGLFLASGQAIATGGPVGALLGYLVMGLITWGIALMTAEISAFIPVTGGFVRHATKFVQPALGCATGWNFWYTMAITAPAEISAAATLIDYWESDINPAVFFTVFIVLIMVLNFCPVKAYGESEVIFGALKIMLIIGLIIAGIIVDLGGVKGQDRLGFRYWKSPGPFVAHLVPGPTGNFLGFWSTLISAAYSYANVQVVALAGAETRDPRRIIPRALRLTFWRVLVFYVLSMFVVGLIVPSDDPNLGVSTGTAEQSPFVIAFTSAGIKVLPSIINAVVCTSAFSCGSSCVFLASRTILGMAEEGHAPKVFLRTNRFGNPYFAVGISLVFLPLVYLSLGSSSSVVFGWFVNITTVAGLIGWTVICGTYLRFFYGMRWQGISRDRLPYKSPLQPYAAWTTLGGLCLVLFFSGYSVFFPGQWSVSTFLTYYIDIAIFAGLWLTSWAFMRDRPVSLAEMGLSEIHVIERENLERRVDDGTDVKGRSWWRKMLS